MFNTRYFDVFLVGLGSLSHWLSGVLYIRSDDVTAINSNSRVSSNYSAMVGK